MQISKELMDAFSTKEREAQHAEDFNFDLAFAWNLCESTVNNIHHGIDPRIWIPRFIEITEERIAEEADPVVIDAYREAIELAQIAFPD